MTTISRSPSYLVRNTYSYCFRMNVPKDLQSSIGKKELRYSLRTGYLMEAKYKARLMAGQVQSIYYYLRKGNGRLKELSHTEIQKMVNSYLKDSVKQIEERMYTATDEELPFTMDREAFFEYVMSLDDIKDDIVEYLGTRDYSTVENIVGKLLKEYGVESIDKSSITYKKLCRGILKAQLEEIDIEKRQMLGDYSDDITQKSDKGSDQNPQTSIKDEPSILLEDLIKEYSNQLIMIMKGL